MSWATFRETLSTFVLFATVIILVISLWSIYNQFRGNSEPPDRSKHRCKNCSKEFTCRAKTPQTTLDSKGDIHRVDNSEERKELFVVKTQESFIPTGGAKPVGALPVDSTGRTIVRRRTVAEPTIVTNDNKQEEKKKGVKVSRRSRAGSVNCFQRRTVNLGSFPIEISEPANKLCCAVYLSPEKPAERFCSYPCYRAMMKQARPSTNTT